MQRVSAGRRAGIEEPRHAAMMSGLAQFPHKPRRDDEVIQELTPIGPYRAVKSSTAPVQPPMWPAGLRIARLPTRD